MKLRKQYYFLKKVLKIIFKRHKFHIRFASINFKLIFDKNVSIPIKIEPSDILEPNNDKNSKKQQKHKIDHKKTTHS